MSLRLRDRAGNDPNPLLERLDEILKNPSPDQLLSGEASSLGPIPAPAYTWRQSIRWYLHHRHWKTLLAAGTIYTIVYLLAGKMFT